MTKPPFLTEDEVLYIHEQQLTACGIDLNDESGTLYEAIKAIGTKRMTKEGLEKFLAALGSVK